MSWPSLVIAVLAGIVAVVAIEAWIRWRLSRVLERARDRVLHPERYPSEPPKRLEPECRFVVRVSDAEVVCERPDGRVERVGWDELQKVEVLTTSAGPFTADVFWGLIGTDGGCCIPQGATGEKELLQRLQALPGFDNSAFIEAMGSTSEARFLCWQRETQVDALD